MASDDAPEHGGSRRPLPNLWELNEILQRLALLPFVLAPRPVGRLAARVLATWVLRPGSWAARTRPRRVPPALIERTGLSARDLARRVEVELMYERILLLRQIVFPGWRRKVGVRGLSNARAGLRESRGVIFWINPCVSSNVAAKQAIATGLGPLVHLSRPSHPFSAGQFGMRFVNPLLRRPEMPFISERVVIDEGRTVSALRRLRQALKENQPVSITVTPQAARLFEHDFLGGRISLPAGPIELAAVSGAPLLPVFTWSDDARAHVEIGAPLPVSRTDEAGIRAAQAAMLDWLAPLVLEHPDAWTGWRTRQFVAEGPQN